jgi:hypothetical protein
MYVHCPARCATHLQYCDLSGIVGGGGGRSVALVLQLLLDLQQRDVMRGATL